MELRVNDTERGGWRYAREVFLWVMFVVSLRMNARVLSVLFESVGLWTGT